jgi:hypothetical protein
MSSRQEMSEEDREVLFDYLREIRNRDLVSFMRQEDISGRSGGKDSLLESLAVALEGGDLDTDNLIELLDRVLPWAKQHVFLLKGPANALVMPWQDQAKGVAML